MAKARKPRIAICYDFDGTLAPGNMQEYDYIPQLKMTSKGFWEEVQARAKEQEGDGILAYMGLMLEKAKADPSKGILVTKNAFADYARKVEFFPGVDSWFERINQYGREHGSIIEHFIISSGIREMIEGTSIAKQFKKIFASSFMYDQHGVAYWPSLALNYTTKTQFLFRINKGNLDVWDDSKINQYLPHNERPVPFERMIYIGDGSTDVPCMRLVKEQGGHSIAVYQPGSCNKKQSAEQLLKEKRVNFIAPADYRKSKTIDKQVKTVIERISIDFSISRL